jgi:hypothetical protein
MTYLSASVDIADEFCHGLPDVPQPAPAIPAECSPAPGDATASKQQSIAF